jgi:hypothetical protein
MRTFSPHGLDFPPIVIGAQARRAQRCLRQCESAENLPEWAKLLCVFVLPIRAGLPVRFVIRRQRCARRAVMKIWLFKPVFLPFRAGDSLFLAQIAHWRGHKIMPYLLKKYVFSVFQLCTM